MGKNFVLRPENTRQPRSFGNTITFGKGRDKGTGYMSHSERVGPGVIVLHEFFGLTPSIRDFTDRLCDEGFTALAVDLYDGATAGSVDEALALMSSLDDERVLLQLKAATEHLASNWHPRVGVVGFSLGAGLTLGLTRRLDSTQPFFITEPRPWMGPGSLVLSSAISPKTMSGSRSTRRRCSSNSSRRPEQMRR